MGDAHAPLWTAAGAAQRAAAEWGAGQFAPSGGDVRALADRMRRLGPRASAALVNGAAGELRAELPPAGLEGAAEAAAAGLAEGDPARPMAIVEAQVRLVCASGPRAVAAAVRFVLHTRAFNTVMPEWAAAAGEYGRDGAAAEAANAVERGRFVRRPTDRFKFTAMSIDLGLRRHERNQVKMYIRRDAIRSPVHVVEYYPFMALLDTDIEEIDSPKAAMYADECEVRLPDGARLGHGGMRVMARKSRLDPEARVQLERLMGLGTVVFSQPSREETEAGQWGRIT